MVTFAGSIAGIELVDTINVTVTGNTLNGGTGLAVGVWLNKGNNGTVVGNTINGFSPGGTGLQIFADGLGSAAAKSNIVSNNGVMLPATGAGSGITILANAALANCSQNIIAGNNVTGNGVAATNGIYVLKALGTLTKTFVYGNSLDKLANGINLHSDDATQISGNIFTSTVMTPITTTASTNLQLFNQVGTAFADLGTPGNGSLVYCTDCTIANPCAAAGTGALAKRLNNVWVCN
jgi:hypothetical protein